MALYSKQSTALTGPSTANNKYMPKAGTTLTQSKAQTGLVPKYEDPTLKTYRAPVIPTSDVATKQVSNIYATGGSSTDVANRAKQFAVNEYGNADRNTQNKIDDIMYTYKTEEGRRKALTDLLGLTTDVEYTPSGNRISAIAYDGKGNVSGTGIPTQTTGSGSSAYGSSGSSSASGAGASMGMSATGKPMSMQNSPDDLAKKYGLTREQVDAIIYKKGTGTSGILALQDLSRANQENATNNFYKFDGGQRQDYGQAQGKSSIEDVIAQMREEAQKRVADYQDAIQAQKGAMRQRVEEQRLREQQSSDMNQSFNRGALGRAFGANADTSEANVFTTENNRLRDRISYMDAQENEALANLDTGVLEYLDKKIADDRNAETMARSNWFQQMMDEAQLTGLYNGTPTMARQQLEETARNNDLRNQLGLFKEQQDLMIKQMQEQGKDTRFDDDLAFKIGQALGQIGGQQTLGATDRELARERLNLSREQFDQLFPLKEGALTGYYGGQDTLARDVLDERNRSALVDELLASQRENRIATTGGGAEAPSYSNIISAQNQLRAINEDYTSLKLLYDEGYLDKDTYEKQVNSLREQERVAQSIVDKAFQ